MASNPPEWAVEFVRAARVGRLATASAGGEPHVIPCVYVLLDGALYSIVDEKPKSGRRLQRLRNIDATGRAALVVDRYDEDWSQLAFVLIRGPATTITNADPRYAPALAALREKYPQYREMSLEDSEMVMLEAERWVAWKG
ncbi:MAG TPA: TIGR03668 family PPOX class F420-dependent oxidoreductase [Thermomicrobiales bacterium]|nr:TIGR03668 family PPOX class F420-dependent oxidoreductase [Thermomicrobiales bacterium]